MRITSITRSALAAAIALGALAPALAHHSGAMFDTDKNLEVEGTVQEWQWINPHAWLQVYTPDGKGGQVLQGFELGSPNTLTRNGFTKDSFKPGDKVRVIYHPRKDGTLGGEFGWAKTTGGTWLRWITSVPMPTD